MHFISKNNSIDKFKHLFPIISQLASLKDINKSQYEFLSLLAQCYTPTTAKFMNSSKSSRYFSVFIRLLSISDFVKSALQMVTQEFFENLHLSQQMKLVEQIYEIFGQQDSEVVQSARETLSRLRISSSHISPIFMAFHQQIVPNLDDRKKLKTQDEILLPGNINVFTSLLEILDSRQDIENSQDLIVPLFDILKDILSLEANVHEYVKQLLLSIINEAFVSLNKLQLVIDAELIQIDTLLQCIRVTDNIQSHNLVFSCLSNVACMHPELVLTSVMPIFTFMGTNVLRQDDDFSFFIIKKTITAIVPVLAKDIILQEELQSVLDVFLKALHHIPKHRRLPIYKILIDELGSSLFLGKVLLMILESEKPENLTWTMNFSSQLIAEFDINIQLTVRFIFLTFFRP